MKECIDNILHEIDIEISNSYFSERDIITNSLKMTQRLQKVLEELRVKLSCHKFESTEEEIVFFKEQKPEILSRLLYFNKVFQIESKFPNGSNEVIVKYLNNELDSLTYFFNRNLDFYQYYRSRLTMYDEYYFLRGKTDLRLNCDSSHFNCDPIFSTGYDFKVAKILAYEMLRIYLNKRILDLSKEKDLEYLQSKVSKSQVNFTGKKIALIELGYALANSGDFNNGCIEIKEMMDFLGAVFNIDLGDYYRTYIAIKDRKKDRTSYMTKLIEILEKRMDENDSY